MSIQIVKVGKKNLKHFINFQYDLYKNDKFWIGELKMDAKHALTSDPFWKHAHKQLFLAYKDGKIAGRIAAIINHTHIEYWGERTGMFGFFECIDDKQVSKALFNAAKEWLREKGMSVIKGPFNPSTNHTCGMLVNGFDEDPFIMMPYNFSYYPELMEAEGFVKAKDLLAFERVAADKFTPRFEKIVARALRSKDIKLRRINLKNLNAEIMTVRHIYNAAWAQNWGFLPISEAEILNTAKQLKMIADAKITCVAEINGVPVGFYIAIPNMNHMLKILKGTILNPFKLIKGLIAWKKIKDVRLIMLGVLPEYRHRGVELILIKDIVEHGVDVGYGKAELSWMLEDNKDIINVVTETGCRKSDRVYRIYQSPI
ncbi:hypothetical protein Emin_1186 [Elusimicrobium minutum Pei191]|uniref:N-acetyltransferase domain-containing protein n=1 Tax=Elusimicrobium minutum (strain Pei191) TaxID=445932 RepID=B2KDZ0_ELUMP|nr:GNAT family N-acetyltransferase [Elusimicrobium minutum]ACC98736.1 hypothetical protein Emin_1186 [Elusimicrobium minutum Pei191]